MAAAVHRLFPLEEKVFRGHNLRGSQLPSGPTSNFAVNVCAQHTCGAMALPEIRSQNRELEFDIAAGGNGARWGVVFSCWQ